MIKILTWDERCEVHPDHQSGMVTNAMIQMRMQEEIDDLRNVNEQLHAALHKIAHDDEGDYDLLVYIARNALKEEKW